MTFHLWRCFNVVGQINMSHLNGRVVPVEIVKENLTTWGRWHLSLLCHFKTIHHYHHRCYHCYVEAESGLVFDSG